MGSCDASSTYGSVGLPLQCTQRGGSWIFSGGLDIASHYPINCYNNVSQIILSFPDNLHESPFLSPTIKFSVKDLFPGTKIKPAFGYGNNYFSSHNLSF
jgi:hypothetical protein